MMRLLFLLFAMLQIGVVFGQVTDLDRDTVNSLIRDSPSFTIFKDNYFITGIPLNESVTETNSDVKFQISFKQRLINKPLPLDFYPYLTYTQKSFWDIYAHSRPFAESNYNPAIIFMKPIYQKGFYSGAVTFGVEHESNGLDEASGSRSWNYFSVSYSQIVSKRFSGSVRLWLPFEVSDNPDLLEYIGIGEATVHCMFIENRLYSNVTFLKAFSWDWRGSYMLNIEYRPFKKGNQYIMLQWFNGYAEGLIDYDQCVNMLRLGIAIRPSFYRFF